MRDGFTDSVTEAVHYDITVECVDGYGKTHTLNATLGYRASDPYAVTMAFHVPGDTVVWTFGRELLTTGLRAPAGDGDVHVWHERDDVKGDRVLIELCSPDGQLLASARADDVRHFLTRTGRAVPYGAESEHLDIDLLLTHLLTA
ncbi:MAG: SsgA family sporulation/cell division regulator [Nocardioides sp.]